MAEKKESARRAKVEARHRELLLFERLHWAEGRVVAGLDEAGAGPLAGPLTAGCVILDAAGAAALVGVDDSKALTAEQRDLHARAIRENALAFAVAEASVEEIDRFNVREAGIMAMERALDAVCAQLQVHHLLIDARKLERRALPQTELVKGDARSLSIAAASILAKVARDDLMVGAADRFPGYGFEKHKGYGTREHIEAIRRLGVTPLHRRTFEPVHTMLTQLSLFD